MRPHTNSENPERVYQLNDALPWSQLRFVGEQASADGPWPVLYPIQRELPAAEGGSFASLRL